jgi:hypothetical protein
MAYAENGCVYRLDAVFCMSVTFRIITLDSLRETVFSNSSVPATAFAQAVLPSDMNYEQIVCRDARLWWVFDVRVA